MGNEQSIVRNVDKRTARREQAHHFVPAIRAFRAEAMGGAPPAAMVCAPGADAPAARGGMRVCVRKRPVFPHELEQGEYDVVTCVGRGGAAQVIVHDARMHPDMRHMFINHHTFAFDAVFGEAASNRQVYAETASQLVQRAVDDSVTATIMMYGQTGSGKTFTMSAIYELASHDLFAAVAAAPGIDGSSPAVSLCFVELAGDKCLDMLNRGKQVQLLTGRDGAVHPYPLAEVPVHSAAELLCFIRLACALRATEATGVHNQSSRSHAVCRIFIDRGGEKEGMLQLIDLAGSEHRIDSAEHDAARRKEGAQATFENIFEKYF
jgi:kinesin family member 2/24